MTGRKGREIADLFTDEPGRGEIVLSSTHKAKGLEWPTVWMLADTYRKAKSNEERNLWYVAVTRAISKLVMVSENFEQQEAAKVEEVNQEPPKVDEPAKKTRRGRKSIKVETSGLSPLWASLMPPS